MKLFIAEKPSLAKAIFEGLGGDPVLDRKKGYFEKGENIVAWCAGHLLELSEPTSKWTLEDLPIKSVWPPKLNPIKDKEGLLNTIELLLKRADSVVNAADPDEEGNLLVDEILTYFNNKKPVERLLVSDLNLEPVKKALAEMQDNTKFEGWTKSALARSIGDQLFGFNMTRAYTLKAREKGYSGVLGIGRVQTVVIGMINERTLLNQSHAANFYYDVFADFQVGGFSIKAKYETNENDYIDEKGHFILEEDSKRILRNTDVKGRVVELVSKEVKAFSPRPFDLSSMQELCAKKYGYTAIETLNALQSLYETHKLLTYPRTDNRFLGESHYGQREEVLEVIREGFPEYLISIDNADKTIKHTCFNPEKIGAHHAITPTLTSSRNMTLSLIEQRIYTIVVVNFICLFYPAAVRDKVTIKFEVNNEQNLTYSASNLQIKERGWEAACNEKEEIACTDWMQIESYSECDVLNQTIKKMETKPLKYHVESSLLGGMKKAGRMIKDNDLRKKFEEKDKGDRDSSGSIGTEATRAAILNTLRSRTGLIEVVTQAGYKEKIWRTTKEGQEFCKILPDSFLTPDISANWAQKQTMIKNEALTVPEFLIELDSFICDQVARIKQEGVSITSDAVKCDKCETGYFIKRKGAKGAFWGCNRYPECKSNRPDKNGRISLKSVSVVEGLNYRCQCGERLVPKKAGPRMFYGCSTFPKCTFSCSEKNVDSYLVDA